MSLSTVEINLEEIHRPPLPEQVSRIVSIGMAVAKEQDAVRKSRRAGNSHVFLPDWLVKEDDAEAYRATTHKYLGIIAKRGYRTWGLRLREGVYVTEGLETVTVPTPRGPEQAQITSSQHGYTNTYSFEWNHKQVSRADKSTHVVVSPYGESEIRDEALGGRFAMTVKGLGEISMADCDGLIREMQLFREVYRGHEG
jgi:hypothetical protein